MIARFEPGGEDVHLDIGYPHQAGPMFESRLERQGFPTDPEPKMQNLLALGVGEALDDYDALPEVPDDGSLVELGNVEDAWNELVEADRESVEDCTLYIGAKVYWYWYFGYERCELQRADEYRLGLPENDLDRAAMAGLDRYWTRSRAGGAAPFKYSPTGRLIREFRSGVFPGLLATPVAQVQRELAAPRYHAARDAFQKATDFLTGDERDLENAAKEASNAVESLGKTALGLPDGASLDDVKNELVGSDTLDRPLDKAFDALYGFRSSQAGVGHGGKKPPDVEVAEAQFALNMAASIALLLLELDKS